MINCVVEKGHRQDAARRGGVGHRPDANRRGRRLAAVHPPVVRQGEGRPGEGQSDRQDAARRLGHSDEDRQSAVGRLD